MNRKSLRSTLFIALLLPLIVPGKGAAAQDSTNSCSAQALFGGCSVSCPSDKAPACGTFLGLFAFCTCRKYIDDIDLIGDFSGADLVVSEENVAQFDRYYSEVASKLSSAEGKILAENALKAMEAARGKDLKSYNYYARLHQATLNILPEEEQRFVYESLGIPYEDSCN